MEDCVEFPLRNAGLVVGVSFHIIFRCLSAYTTVKRCKKTKCKDLNALGVLLISLNKKSPWAFTEMSRNVSEGVIG